MQATIATLCGFPYGLDAAASGGWRTQNHIDPHRSSKIVTAHRAIDPRISARYSHRQRKGGL